MEPNIPFYLSLEIIEVFLKSCSFSNDFPMNLAAPGLTSRLSSQKPNVDGGALGLKLSRPQDIFNTCSNWKERKTRKQCHSWNLCVDWWKENHAYADFKMQSNIRLPFTPDHKNQQLVLLDLKDTS